MMSQGAYSEMTALAIDFQVVRQFARLLRKQARMLEADGDVGEAATLRDHAARSERDMYRSLPCPA
jgi:hypothetical protein